MSRRRSGKPQAHRVGAHANVAPPEKVTPAAAPGGPATSAKTPPVAHEPAADAPAGDEVAAPPADQAPLPPADEVASGEAAAATDDDETTAGNGAPAALSDNAGPADAAAVHEADAAAAAAWAPALKPPRGVRARELQQQAEEGPLDTGTFLDEEVCAMRAGGAGHQTCCVSMMIAARPPDGTPPELTPSSSNICTHTHTHPCPPPTCSHAQALLAASAFPISPAALIAKARAVLAKGAHR